MDLDKLRIFYYAAKNLSLTNSGLNLSPSSVSRHIADLEHRMKVKLFQRLPRGLKLTEEGELLFVSAEKVFRELEGAQSKINDLFSEPQGLLRIAMPTGWASVVLVRFISGFLKTYPKIRMELIATDEPQDIDFTRLDGAFMPFVPDRMSLIQRYLLSVELGLYASKEYLDVHGTPTCVEDLDAHNLIAFSSRGHGFADIDWHLFIGFKDPEGRQPYLRASNIYHAAEEGLGITTLATSNPLLREGRLVRVLADVQGPKIDGYFVFPEHHKDSKKVRLLSDYMAAQLKEADSYSM